MGFNPLAAAQIPTEEASGRIGPGSKKVSELKNVAPAQAPNTDVSLRSLENMEPGRRRYQITGDKLKTTRSSVSPSQTSDKKRLPTAKKTNLKNSKLRYYRVHR